MSKKILAVLLALVCVVTLFAACGKKETTEDNTTTTVDPFEAFGEDDETTAAPADETTEAPADETTAAPADETTAAPADETTAAPADETTTEAATEGPKAPQTKEEIVAYFNTASNGVKANAKVVIRNYSKISLAGSTKLPGWADSVLKVLGGADKFINDQLTKNSKGSETFKDADIKAVYPVEGESYVSKLTAADVKEAQIKESNGEYMIKITTVADGKSSTVKHGEGHAPKAFNVVLPGVVNDNIPGVAKNMVGECSMDYPSSTVIITVDAATGRVKTADYTLYWTINFGDDIVLPFVTHDNYTITY